MFRDRTISLIVLGTISLLGCAPASGPTPQASAHEDHPHQHAHASRGPHGGEIIELGNEDFHAELVHDDRAGNVTIYFLDASAQNAAPIDAVEVNVNLRHDGQAQQFRLAALADQGDPQGRASRFVSAQQELANELDHGQAHGQLVVTINGKQYRGNIDHAHDHHGHGDHNHE